MLLGRSVCKEQRQLPQKYKRGTSCHDHSRVHAGVVRANVGVGVVVTLVILQRSRIRRSAVGVVGVFWRYRCVVAERCQLRVLDTRFRIVMLICAVVMWVRLVSSVFDVPLAIVVEAFERRVVMRLAVVDVAVRVDSRELERCLGMLVKRCLGVLTWRLWAT